MRFFLLFLLSGVTQLNADPIEGEWLKGDGSARIILRIDGKGKLNGTISWIKDKTRTQDTKNPKKALRSRKLIGLQIVSGFWKEGKEFTGGTVYDSRKGKTYKGKIWLNGTDKLTMRGYVGVSLLGKSATWSRYKK